MRLFRSIEARRAEQLQIGFAVRLDESSILDFKSPTAETGIS
jgi:hypothetical protein